MTTEEKIEVIKAYSEGKAIEIYSKFSEKWLDKTFDIWDFDMEEYRVKPNEAAAKFKAGDVLLAKKDEHQVNPTRFEVTDIKLEYYCFKDHLGAPIIDVDKNYINERDALWYFEIYDYVTKKFYMRSTRMTMNKMDEEFGTNHYTLSWQPIYNLGFKLKDYE
mgnify:CR=1 FL=1